MSTMSALMDNSLYHRICEQSPEMRERLWSALHDRYQIIIPLVMIEEVMASFGHSQMNRAIVEEMAEQIVKLRPCWMDDVFEIAFRELVLKEKFDHIPTSQS
jgi:hypothetical protein